VFQGSDEDGLRPFDAIKCTERLAEVCPYCVHTPIVKEPPKPKPPPCQYCQGRHTSPIAQAFCETEATFKKELQPWNPEGSVRQIWADLKMATRYHANIWPWIAGRIFERDKWKCQDCGIECSTYEFFDRGTFHNPYAEVNNVTIPFEVHHILPRGMGGSDHPANLKLVCQNCHKKYNEKFNGEIISKKAQERKTQKVKQMMPKSLEEFA